MQIQSYIPHVQHIRNMLHMRDVGLNLHMCVCLFFCVYGGGGGHLELTDELLDNGFHIICHSIMKCSHSQ